MVYREGAAPRTGGYEPVIERLRAVLADAGLTPVPLLPASGLPEAEFYALAKELERGGEVVFVTGDLGMAPSAHDDARARLVAACEAHGRVSLGAYRDLLGTSRKTAEALLRHFDAAGLTRRDGDDRVLRRRSRGGSDPILRN
jgi:selenocysteine-specific elongation factor